MKYRNSPVPLMPTKIYIDADNKIKLDWHTEVGKLLEDLKPCQQANNIPHTK